MCKNKDCGNPEGGREFECGDCLENKLERAVERAQARAWERYEEQGHW